MCKFYFKSRLNIRFYIANICIIDDILLSLWLKQNIIKVEKDIRDLKLNPENPRIISEFMEGKLIESILVFPNMLKLRPILIDKAGVVVGGNSRLKCLTTILDMDDNEILDYLMNQKKFRTSTESEKKELTEYWEQWKDCPLVPVRELKDLSPEEIKEVLVKDNLHYGEDDMEVMKTFFDRDSIKDYFGYVEWDMYDYSDKINDKNLDITKDYPESFRCGYVTCQMTDSEFRALCARLEKYLEANNGISDGFLTSILMSQ